MDRQEIETFVIETISKVLNKPVRREDNYFDLGGESLEIQDTLGIINAKYNIKIRVKELIKLKYIDEIAEYISLKITSGI
jgi:hypothetical protein